MDAPTGATRCIPCSSGSYSATNDSLFCPLCPEGTYGPLPGASSCAECVAPNYQPFLGQINCSTCGPGFVVDKLNATTSCTSCDAPKFVSSIGQLECKNCSAGHVVDKVTAATMCSSCDAPNYVGSLGATACDSCRFLSSCFFLRNFNSSRTYHGYFGANSLRSEECDAHHLFSWHLQLAPKLAHSEIMKNINSIQRIKAALDTSWTRSRPGQLVCHARLRSTYHRLDRQVAIIAVPART